MMSVGRQINFFLAPQDQEPFERALREAGDFRILRSRPRSTTPEFESSTVIRRYGEEPLRILLVQPGDAAKIIFEPIAGRGEFSCDPVAEPVIEFDRCFASDRLIRRGRLYFVPKYYGAKNELLSKSANFIAWGGRLFEAARSHLTKIGSNLYVGENAARLQEAGVTLEKM
jgi:hypothetical protein